MTKNTLWAIIFTLIIFIVWTYYLKKNSVPPVNTSSISFSGIERVIPDYENDRIRIQWLKAVSKNPVTYWIYVQEKNKITQLDQPSFYSAETNYLLPNLDFSQDYYFLVKAVDSFRQVDTNQKQIYFHPIKKKTERNEQIITFENKKAKFLLSTLGGSIKSIILKDYKNIHNEENVNLILYPDKKAVYLYPLSLQFIDQNHLDSLNLNDFNTYQFQREGNKIIFSSMINQITVIKEFTFYPNEYFFDLKIILNNPQTQNIKFNRLVLKWQPTLGPENKIDKYDKLVVAYYHLEKLSQISIKSKQYNQWVIKKSENAKWLSFFNRYFVAAIIPEETYRVKEELFYSDGTKFIGGLSSQIDAKQLWKDKNIEFNYTIYAGPKLRDKFRAIKKFNTLESTILTQRVFLGKLINQMGNLFLDILIFIDRIVKNFGLAVILFSILIKVILYPLTHKQLESMSKMQKIQPVINQVKEQFKSDPKRLNVELMRIYKKHKVNPFGGCLPLLLQIPIFFAIWDMLQYSLELRNANFLWIKSLALPDTVGYLAGIPINPLPILMGVTMLIQQTQTSVDPKQKTMTYFLPLLFLFFFWGMPSGLVLYWTIQNILSILQQLLIIKGQNKSKVEVVP